MIAEVKRGVPSYVTGDLSAKVLETRRDELRERMSGNLCRCGAYNGIIDRVVHLQGPAGSRTLPLSDLHRLRATLRRSIRCWRRAS